jgi:SAM-dependent methyltransferase
MTHSAVRPSRADVTVSYDLGVKRYEQVWSPVILPAAAAVVPWLGLADRSVVLDVGGGTGALAPALRSAAAGVSVVAVDASAGMLRFARRRGVAAVRADALALPVADGSADAVVLAYVLFHLADPLAALREAWRVLRPGRRVATVTWAVDRPAAAQAVWDQTMADAGAPTLPVRRVDAGLDSADSIERLLVEAGFVPQRVWSHALSRQWDLDSFWALASGSGIARQRLAALDPGARPRLLGQLRARLEGLGPEDFYWEGEVVCAVATRPAGVTG